MSFMTELKAQCRQVIHDLVAIPATYTDTASGAITEGVTIRWHFKPARIGDINGTGYPMVLDSVDRIILNIPNLIECGIDFQTFKPGDVITPTEPEYHGASLILDSREPIIGPVEVSWAVVLDEQA